MLTELTEKEHERRRVALAAAQGNGGFATSVAKVGKSVKLKKPIAEQVQKPVPAENARSDFFRVIQEKFPLVEQNDSPAKVKMSIPEKGKDGKYALDSRRVALPILVRLCHDNGVEPREGSDFSKTACWLNTLIAGGFVAGITLSEGGKKKISQKKNFPSGSKLPEKWAIALAIPKGSMVSNKDHSSSPSRRRVQAPHLGIGVV